MTSVRNAARGIGFSIALLAAGRSLGAQGVPADTSGGPESREVLEAQAQAAEQGGRRAEAALLRSRLTNGDFQEGDRIVITLLGSSPLHDTLSVRAGKLLPLPRMGEVPLEGVLRSELMSRISSHLAKYLRDSSVRVTPLLRIAVLGPVGAPGFYYVSADVLLSDVLMRAGGPTQMSDLEKMEIRRGGETIWDRKRTQEAVASGLSLERLHLRAGDEVVVGEKKQHNWIRYAQGAAAVLSLVVTIIALR